ncbi:hypothetical protein EMCRGX_G033133 [Ephydatia muelleri]
MILIWFWSKDAPVTSAATDADVNNHTSTNCYQWLREVCSTTLINNGPFILGGPGVIVQVDESLFRHKPKVAVFLSQILIKQHREICESRCARSYSKKLHARLIMTKWMK